MAVKGTKIDGDVTIGRNSSTGGDADVAGNARVGHDLRVEGWLDAPNIKGPDKGMFPDEATLYLTYPLPRNGWRALVGTKFPAAIYLAKNGKWYDTHEKYENPSVHLTDYATKRMLDQEIAEQNQNIEDFKKSVQSQINDYQPIINNGNVTNAADEEDITSNEHNLLQFKDRNNLNGMGYKILRLADGILNPLAINVKNTIYHIRYNFDLGGKTIVLQDDSTLEFVGGSFRNGKILNAKNIKAETNAKIFGEGLTVDTEMVSLRWFGADEKTADCSDALNRALMRPTALTDNDLKKSRKVYVPSGTYNFKDTIHNFVNAEVEGENRDNTLLKIDYTEQENRKKPFFHIQNRALSSAGLKNLRMVSKRKKVADNHGYHYEKYGTCVINDETAKSLKLNIENCEINSFHIALKNTVLIDSLIKNTLIHTNDFGYIAYYTGDVSTSTVFANVYFSSNEKTITILKDSTLNISFTDGTIIEGSTYYAVYVQASINLHYILFGSCYFEHNNCGRNADGQLPNFSDVLQLPKVNPADTWDTYNDPYNEDYNGVYSDIITIDTDYSEFANTFVLSLINCEISGTNRGVYKGFGLVKAVPGNYYMWGNRITRLEYLVNYEDTKYEWTDGYYTRLEDQLVWNEGKWSEVQKPKHPKMPTKLTGSSYYFGGGEGALFKQSEDPSKGFKYSNLEMDIEYVRGGKVLKYSTNTSLCGDVSKMPDNGVGIGTGSQGATNTLDFLRDKKVCFSANNNQTIILGAQGSGTQPVKNANAKGSICIKNTSSEVNQLNNLLSRGLEDIDHTYIKSIGNELHVYKYDKESGKFKDYKIMLELA